MAFDDQDQQVDLDTWEKRVFEKHGVPEGLRMSIRNQESGGDVNATSPTGVKGRYQVTQKTAANFGLNRDDPWEQPVAAARLLRQGYDDAKRKNPKFSDRQAWLASSASYYAGPDAFDADGNLSVGSKDGLSNPSRYAESIAQKWADFERGSRSAQPALQPEPSTIRKAIVPGRQQTTVRGPVRPARPDPFGLTAPDIAGDAAAIASRISPEVGVEADRRGRELTRFQGRSRLGQLGEVAAGGLMQGVDQMVKAANTINPYMSPQMSMAQRRQGMMTPDAQQNLQRQQAAQDVALPNTAPIVRGTVAAGSQLPAIALAGPAAPLVAGGLAASNADWRDPKRAALQTAIGLAGGAAGGKLAQMAIRPATMGGRLASGAAGGAAGNVIPLAGEQLAYEGRLNPQQLAQQAVIGAATGAALPPGADPRSRVRQVRPESPIDVPVYDDTGEITGYDRINAPLTPDVVGQGVNRAGDLGATVQRAGDIRPRPRGTAPMPIQNRIEQQRPPILARQTQAMPIQAPEPVRPLAILQENANEAKINAAQFEQSGDWESAQREYDVAHKTLVEAQRQMRRVRNQTPEQADALSAIAREISGAALNRNRASRSATVARREQGIAGRQARKAQDVIENALTADLPAETNPLLKSVVNPESGIPPAEESASGIFGQLARQRAAEQAKPQRGPKDSGQLSAAEYLKRASNGEGIRVSDRGEARILGSKEAGIVGLTNRASKYAVSDAQVMLDEGGFSLQDGRKFTDPSVTENDVLAFLVESGREGRMNTRDLDQRIEREAAEHYENQPTGEVRPASNRLPRIGDLPPSRMAGLRPERPEIPRETSRPLTVAEQARQAGGSTDDLAVLDRLNQRLAVEEPRPYGERTRHGEPGSGGRSLSPYADLIENNRGAFDQLEKMDLESPEAGEILARIDDYVERRGIDPIHLVRKLNSIRSNQVGEARRADEGVGSGPLRQTPSGELRDFFSRPDEAPPKSEPLRPVRLARPAEMAPVSRKETAPVAPEPVRNPIHSALDSAAAEKSSRSDVRKWVDVARDKTRKPDARKRAERQLMKASGVKDVEGLRVAIRDYEFPATATERDVAAMSAENLTRAIETSDAQSARRIKEGERTTQQDVEWAQTLNDERRHRVAMGAMKSLYEKRPGRGDEDVATFTDDVLAKRIADAEKILNNPGLSEARAQQIEDFLAGAEKERDARAAKSRTVSHPDPAIDGQLILATTADGRVIVANEGNKSGVSVVKDRLTTEPKPDRAPIKYAIPDEAMPELRKPGSGVSRERELKTPPVLSGDATIDSMNQRERREFWYHGSHQNLQELSPRLVQNYNSLGTWFTSRMENAPEYGPNVYEVPAVKGNFMDAWTEDYDRLFASNLPLIEKHFGKRDAEQLRSVPPNSQRYGQLRKKDASGGFTPSEVKEYRSLQKTHDITRKAMLSSSYMRDWRAMMKDAGYDGMVFRDTQIDMPPGSPAHSIYLVFNDDAIPLKKVEVAPNQRGALSNSLNSDTNRQRGNQPPPMPDRVTARDLADNVRAEYRPAKNRPGTVYLNDWGLEALNAADYLEFRAGREGAADDRITGGVNYPPEEARQIADHIRERAGRPNFSEDGRKNLETMARQIELAADDGNVSFVPMKGQALGQAKATIRHEAFHSQQSAIHPDVHELTTPRWLRAQRFGAAIGEELSRRGYSERQHPAEAAAFVASGNWDAFGMSRDDARQFLTDYFDDVAYRHGKEAISKFRAIHPALQEVVEARRGTNEPRFGSPGLGRNIGSAVNRQRGVERPSGSVARSRGSVPGGEAGSVRGQSQTAALRAITPESLRAGQPAESASAQSPRRQGLAGIRAEDLRAPGAPPPPTPRSPREPVSGVPTGKDVSGFDYLRSRLSNLNFTGTYERLAGARGREASEIIRNAQVEIAYQPDTERASLVSDLRRQLQPFKAEFRDNGQPGLANWMDAHVDAINDADAAFKGLAGFLRGFHYNTKLRYNPKSAALNSLQPLQTLWPHVTTREFAKLMKDARTPSIRARVLKIAERESGGQVEEVSKRGRFEAVPKVLRNPFAVASDTNRVVGHLAGEMFADRMGLTGHAKARMAADWTKKIEYDNSQWDVPPLFSGRLAGVIGQFKSFTVKNLERLHADWKAAPEGSGTGNLARRAKMITGQVVLGGVRSIPGVKQIGGVLVLGALARAFSDVGLDEDDANKAAEAVYFGAPGLIEQDISSSMMILDAPFGNTPAEQAVNYLGGPTLSLIVKAFKEGETMIDAEGGRGSTAGEKRKAAAIRLAKATTPYAKTVEAAADLAQGRRPALKMERRQVPMTNLEVAGKLGMATPLRQSKFYEEKDAYDWQKRAARKLKPARP